MDIIPSLPCHVNALIGQLSQSEYWSESCMWTRLTAIPRGCLQIGKLTRFVLEFKSKIRNFERKSTDLWYSYSLILMDVFDFNLKSSQLNRPSRRFCTARRFESGLSAQGLTTLPPAPPKCLNLLHCLDALRLESLWIWRSRTQLRRGRGLKTQSFKRIRKNICGQKAPVWGIFWIFFVSLWSNLPPSCCHLNPIKLKLKKCPMVPSKSLIMLEQKEGERETDFGRRNVQHSRSTFWADFEAACHSADVQTGAVRPQCICKNKKGKEKKCFQADFLLKRCHCRRSCLHSSPICLKRALQWSFCLRCSGGVYTPQLDGQNTANYRLLLFRRLLLQVLLLRQILHAHDRSATNIPSGTPKQIFNKQEESK